MSEGLEFNGFVKFTEINPYGGMIENDISDIVVIGNTEKVVAKAISTGREKISINTEATRSTMNRRRKGLMTILILTPIFSSILLHRLLPSFNLYLKQPL